MEEQLINFETAKLAKEKGFKVYTIIAYTEEGEVTFSQMQYEGQTNIKKEYSAPTQALLQKWLRDVHRIDVYCEPAFINKYERFSRKWKTNFHKNGILNTKYEQALENGLFEALKLIK